MSNDPIHSPSHYDAGSGIECIDAMRAAFHPSEVAAFCKLNAFKYIWRAGKKGDTVEDLEKAMVYLGWTIDATREDEPEPETGVDSAALMQEIQQRAYAEFLAGQERAADKLDTAASASVGFANEQNLSSPNPAIDRINNRLGELGSRVIGGGSKITRIE